MHQWRKSGTNFLKIVIQILQKFNLPLYERQLSDTVSILCITQQSQQVLNYDLIGD